MRSTGRFVLAVAIGCLIVIWSEHRVNAQGPKPVSVTRLYTGPDGQSHSEQIEVSLLPSGAVAGTYQSSVAATKVAFLRCPPGWVNDLHTAGGVGGRQYVMTISGKGEVELPDGTKIPVTPGRIVLGEDLTGKGHITRTVGNEDWVSVHVYLADK